MLRSLLALALLLAPFGVLAQSFPSQEPLTIAISPTYPKPYETVTVTVGSTLVDLAASTITIYAGGAEVEKGMRSAQVKMGGPGSRTTIRAVAAGAEGTYEKSLTIAPSDISLVVEPATTMHPLYDGAGLVASEGKLRIVAVADLRTAPGTRIPSSQISYTWRLGNQVLQVDSGLGRSVLNATAPVRYRDAVVSVTATNAAKTISAQASVAIAPADPIVRIYRSDPLSGISFEKALSGSFALVGSEETFRVVPFFFKEIPAIAWSLNGSPSGSGQDVTVRSSSGAGTAQLGVVATGKEARADANLTLRFGEGGIGIFGR